MFVGCPLNNFVGLNEISHAENTELLDIFALEMFLDGKYRVLIAILSISILFFDSAHRSEYAQNFHGFAYQFNMFPKL